MLSCKGSIPVFAVPALLLIALKACPGAVYAAGSESIKKDASAVWLDEGIGNGFRKGLTDFGFSLGAGAGAEILGSSREHDLALASFHFGRVLSGLLAKERWYRGNFELLGELFAGSQFSPDSRFFAGLTPLLRYNFMTGSRWIPFADLGVGVSLTDIGKPDLGGLFEFNLQLGAGSHYFYQKDKAFTIECKHLHFSSAGINDPNRGTNTEMVTAGFSWYF